jgi:D-beta-D-heptose 7-phosphate kinase/D-beta-D-heptose 1-phosphate adenosyltransferase
MIKTFEKLVVVSGGYDPLHVGHIRHFKAAKELGDKLVVILNSDRFLKEKKGYVFMPYLERKEILESLKCIDSVVECIDTDETIAETLTFLKPDILAKGGDRDISNLPQKELDACKLFNIKIVTKVGGEKLQSSSKLVDNARKITY